MLGNKPNACNQIAIVEHDLEHWPFVVRARECSILAAPCGGCSFSATTTSGHECTSRNRRVESSLIDETPISSYSISSRVFSSLELLAVIQMCKPKCFLEMQVALERVGVGVLRRLYCVCFRALSDCQKRLEGT